MKRLLKILSILIIVFLICIYIPKPTRMFVKERNIERIEFSCFTKRFKGEISEENYDVLFEKINKSFIFTRMAKTRLMSADMIIIYYEDGTKAIISSTNVGWNKLSIYKNTFDVREIEDLIEEKMDWDK